MTAGTWTWTVPCPTCGAGVSQPCHTKTGKVATHPHGDRVENAITARREARNG